MLSICHDVSHPPFCSCQRPKRCADCDNLTFCALDCGIAPWNQDRSPPPGRGEARRFRYLLRFRRWLRYPLDHSHVKWMNPS